MSTYIRSAHISSTYIREGWHEIRFIKARQFLRNREITQGDVGWRSIMGCAEFTGSGTQLLVAFEGHIVRTINPEHYEGQPVSYVLVPYGSVSSRIAPIFLDRFVKLIDDVSVRRIYNQVVARTEMLSLNMPDTIEDSEAECCVNLYVQATPKKLRSGNGRSGNGTFISFEWAKVQ